MPQQAHQMFDDLRSSVCCTPLNLFDPPSTSLLPDRSIAPKSPLLAIENTYNLRVQDLRYAAIRGLGRTTGMCLSGGLRELIPLLPVAEGEVAQLVSGALHGLPLLLHLQCWVAISHPRRWRRRRQLPGSCEAAVMPPIKAREQPRWAPVSRRPPVRHAV